MIIESVTHRSISAKIDSLDFERINTYIQGAVYCWCKNVKDNNGENLWFIASDLFGGENFFWEGTPLYVLYNWHLQNGASDPVNMAGRDVGHILKSLIDKDPRVFHTRPGRRREYLWTGN
ncbi:hypothetical protein [Leptospira yanagawae]|uniref:hypothetical protein n=1 Tax=Leptospira yanagawae TaxID=293069 RepID=UPI0005874238|nr:hypothetical protein [Leptospira yanagawae]